MPFKFNPFTGTLDYYEAGSGGGAWGDITGTLSDQTDLQTVLDDKQDILTEGAFVDGDKTKLDGIEAGAEVNNISDANATDLTDGGTTTLHSHAGGGGDTARDQANYVYSSTTTASDPGATYFRLNYNTVESVTTKIITNNVATLTTVATHNYAVNDYVYVSIGDATFDGWQTITAVNAGAKTFSFAKTAASIASTATSGTAFNVTKITDLYIDTTGTNSTDYTEFIKQLNPGDTLVFVNTTTATKWLSFRVARAVTDNTGWYTVKITWLGGTTPPDNNDTITLLTAHSRAGLMHVWQTTIASSTENPPSTMGADGDWCIILPSRTDAYKNYGARIIQKTAGAWQPQNNTGSSTLLDAQLMIPTMGQSVTPSPVTGQGVAIPSGSAQNIVQKDWYTNTGVQPALKFSAYHISPTVGQKISVGKGLGSFGNENLAFFGATGNVQALPMDTDSIKMKFSTNTAASDPGTEYIKVNNATATSVTAVYTSELGYTRTVTNKVLTSGVATLTVSAAHSYFVGQSITVAGVDATFNGTYVLTAVAATTLSYNKQYTVTNKALTSNVATLTIGTHNMLVGESITITGVDATFNGTYTLSAVAATTISYALVAANVVSTSATGTAAWANVVSAASGGSTNANLVQQFSYPATSTPSVTELAPYAIRIVQDSDATRFIHIWSSAATTDNGTWRTTPATFAQVGAGGLPANLADVTVKFYYNNAIWVANGYGSSQYGVGVCVRGDGNVSLRGVTDRGIFSSKGGTAYITNSVLTANVVTLTTSQAHGFAIGDSITVTNATNAVYNGSYTITTVPTTTTFTYAKTNANIGSAVSIGEVTNGAQVNDYIYVEKYIAKFQAYLVRNNNQVYALPAAGQPPFILAALLAFDDLLGTQGLMYTATSRDGYAAPKYTF